METNISLDDVHQIMFNFLSIYKVEFSLKNYSGTKIFEVPKFGTKVVYYDKQTYDKKVLVGWHIAYIHVDYTVMKARDAIFFALQKGGYVHYLRTNYKNTFNQAMTMQGWDRTINKERKKLYKDLPKYSYLKELINFAEGEGTSYVLAMDPGFYDYIIQYDN